MEYRILQPLSFHAGALLGLTEEQAHTRRAVLKAVRGGLYEVLTTVQFKAGEIVKFDGSLPKTMALAAEPVEQVKEVPKIIVQKKPGRPRKEVPKIIVQKKPGRLRSK